MEIDKNILAIILVIALVSIGSYIYVNTSPSQTISVNGNSEITAEPDLVSVYINIETLDKSAQVAKDENAEITSEVMDALDKLNFEDDEIETISYNIYEEYDWSDGGRTFLGYKVNNRIKVTMEEYNFVASVVDKVVNSGGLIQSINFELSPEHEEELKAEALKQAAESAKVKAEAVAEGAGGKLGRLVSLNAGEYRYHPYPLYEAGESFDSAQAKSSVTQIAPRDLIVYGNVQAVYKIR